MDSLESKTTPAEVSLACERLPETLDDMYYGLLLRIDLQESENRQLAEKVICWVSYTLESLQLRQLQEALAFGSGISKFDSSSLVDQNVIVSVCAGLVEIDQCETVVLVHYTAYDFLNRLRLEKYSFANAMIAMTCVNSLSYATVERSFAISGDDERDLRHFLLEGVGFLAYTCRYWKSHVAIARDPVVNEALARCLSRRQSTKGPSEPSSLCIAITAGLEDVVRRLLLDDEDLESSDPYHRKTPLEMAAMMGHTAIFKLLLQAGSRAGDSVLYIAALSGSMGIVDLILKSPVASDFQLVKFKDSTSQEVSLPTNSVIHTSLKVAIENGNVAIAEKLLSYCFVDGDSIDLSCLARDSLSIGWTTPPLDEFKPMVRLLMSRIPRSTLGWSVDAALNIIGDCRESIMTFLLSQNERSDKPGVAEAVLLVAAMTYKDDQIVEMLFSQVSLFEESLLHRAIGGAAFGSYPAALLSLSLGRNWKHEPKDKYHTTSLQQAANKGNLLVVLVLLSKGVDPSATNKKNDSAISLAARRGHEEVLKALVNHQKAQSLEKKRQWQHRALFLAAVNGHLAIIYFLLHNESFSSGRKDLADSLLKYVTAFNRNKRSIIIRALVDVGGKIANGFRLTNKILQLMCRQHDTDSAQLLLEHGADPNVKGMGQEPVITEISARGDAEMVELFLRHGADPNVRNASTKSALSRAYRGGHEKVTELLLNYGAYPVHLSTTVPCRSLRIRQAWQKALASYNQGGGSLHHFAINGEVEKYGEELNKGANIEGRNIWGETALMRAVKAGQLAIVETSLERGARVESVTTWQRTPLMFAAQNGHVDIAQRLIDYGDSLDSQDIFGLSAVHFGAQNGHEDMVRLLLAQGANASSIDTHGLEALDLAHQKGHASILNLLEEHKKKFSEALVPFEPRKRFVERHDTLNGWLSGNERSLPLKIVGQMLRDEDDWNPRLDILVKDSSGYQSALADFSSRVTDCYQESQWEEQDSRDESPTSMLLSDLQDLSID